MTSSNPNKSVKVCLRKTVSVYGDVDGELKDYGLFFPFSHVTNLPFEPLVNDVISIDFLREYGVVERRRIYEDRGFVDLKFYENPNESSHVFQLELYMFDDRVIMSKEYLDQNSIEDFYQLWLCLLKQFSLGYGMDTGDYRRFESFTNEWYPKFEDTGLV